MKKISIVLAILAVFLVFSCSNAAGPVDNAGNPVDLAGSWSGSVAYKAEQLAPVSIFTRGVNVENGKANWDTNNYDYQGTWVKKDTVTKPKADYSTTETEGTRVTTTKHIFDTKTTTVTEKRVVAADGGYVVTKVTKDEWTERAAIPAVADTTTAHTKLVYGGNTYTVDEDGNNDGIYDDPVWTSWGASFPKSYAGVQTVTETITVKVTAQADGLFTEEITSVKVTEKTGDRFKDPNTAYSTVTEETANTVVNSNKDKTELGFYIGSSFITLDNDSNYEHTVKVADKKQVAYANDVTETLTFVVAKDGTYTLTSVKVETQAAAAAVEATDTHYAAAERKAGTLTTTIKTTGNVVAWTENTANSGDVNTMVLSSNSKTKDVVGADALKDKTENTDYSVFAAGSYSFKILTGEGKKDDTIKTRLYVGAFGGYGSNYIDANVIIFDKAPEAAE